MSEVWPCYGGQGGSLSGEVISKVSSLCEVSFHETNTRLSFPQHEILGKFQFCGLHCLSSVVKGKGTYVSLRMSSCLPAHYKDSLRNVDMGPS